MVGERKLSTVPDSRAQMIRGVLVLMSLGIDFGDPTIPYNKLILETSHPQ